MTDERSNIAGYLMVTIDRVIRHDMEELGVPPDLRPNCLWAAKKYMRKVLRDLTDIELEYYRECIRQIAGTEDKLDSMVAEQPELVLTDDLLSLIKIAIRGYLHYKKVRQTFPKPSPRAKIITLH